MPTRTINYTVDEIAKIVIAYALEHGDLKHDENYGTLLNFPDLPQSEEQLNRHPLILLKVGPALPLRGQPRTMLNPAEKVKIEEAALYAAELKQAFKDIVDRYSDELNLIKDTDEDDEAETREGEETGL